MAQDLDKPLDDEAEINDALRKRLAQLDPKQFKVNAEAMAAYLFWKITADAKDK